MNKLLRIIIIGIVLIFCTIENLYSQDGGLPGAFLRNGVGVRAMGVGGAYIALSNDVSGIYWNPAGLSRITKNEFSAMYTFLSLQRMHSFAGFAYPIKKYGTVAVGWINYYVYNIDGRDAWGNQTEMFKDNENVFLLSYGYRYKNLSFGVTGKFLYNKLYYNSAKGYGFDIGASYKFGFSSVGIVLRDILGNLKWNTASAVKEKFPMTAGIGYAVKPYKIPLLVMCDVNVPIIMPDATYKGFFKVNRNIKDNVKLNIGAEYTFINKIFLRAGYNNSSELTAGFGYNHKMKKYTLKFDYAFAFDVLRSYIHRVGVSIDF